MRFYKHVKICHGVDKKITSRQLALIIASHLFAYLPKELEAGSSVVFDVDIEFHIPNSLTRLT